MRLRKCHLFSVKDCMEKQWNYSIKKCAYLYDRTTSKIACFLFISSKSLNSAKFENSTTFIWAAQCSFRLGLICSNDTRGKVETIWIEEATLMVALLCANYYVYSNAYGAWCQIDSGVWYINIQILGQIGFAMFSNH